MREPALLLVDDVRDNLVAVEAALAPLGHRTLLAHSGEEALRHLLTEDVAVIVLDVQMPGLDGFETARHIKERERTREVPIVFLTALGGELEHRLRGYDVGAVDYIAKPVNAELLRAKVRVFLDLYLATTELKVQSAELTRRGRELERSNADLEQFSYIASHDLQEPLRVIAGYLECLADRLGPDLDEEARVWVDRAEKTAARMSAMITDLLAYARAGAFDTEAADVELADALREATDAVGAALRESGGEVNPVGALGRVRAVRLDVERVLQNLLANALKYRGAEVPVVTVASHRAGDEVIVSVRDNGAGVTREDLERVFGRFERVADEPYPGTGLGLAVCRRIVERSGGRIWMERNDPDPGVTVRFALPAAP